MKKLLLSLVFFAGLTGLAQAQSERTTTKGTNPDPDAPVNISEPGLRPAKPATYSATSLPDAQKGQFYVKDDKPATSDGQIIVPITPEQQKALDNFKANQAADSKNQGVPAKPAAKKRSSKK